MFLKHFFKCSPRNTDFKMFYLLYAIECISLLTTLLLRGTEESVLKGTLIVLYQHQPLAM